MSKENPYNELYPPEEIKIRPGETALLVIDMQYLDAHPDWGIGLDAKTRGLQDKFEYYWHQVETIIPRIRHLQDACRASGIEVIHVRIASVTRDCRDSSKGHHLRGRLVPPDSQEARFIEEVGPVGDEVIISKTSSGAFNSTAIDQTLRNLGIQNLIACGVATSACVGMTVRDAADRNYGVILAHDACAAVTEELHQAGLLTMNGFMGLVQLRSTEEVLRLIDQVRSTASYKR